MAQRHRGTKAQRGKSALNMDEQDGQDEELTLPEHAKNAKKSGFAGTGINGGGVGARGAN